MQLRLNFEIVQEHGERIHLLGQLKFTDEKNIQSVESIKDKMLTYNFQCFIVELL